MTLLDANLVNRKKMKIDIKVMTLVIIRVDLVYRGKK